MTLFVFFRYDVYCKYKENGCSATVKYEKLVSHEYKCIYNPLNDQFR